MSDATDSFPELLETFGGKRSSHTCRFLDICVYFISINFILLFDIFFFLVFDYFYILLFPLCLLLLSISLCLEVELQHNITKNSTSNPDVFPVSCAEMRRAPPAPPWAWSASCRREGSQQPCTTRAKAWSTAMASGGSCSAPPPPPTWRQTRPNPPHPQTHPLARGRRPRPPPLLALTSRARPTTTSWPPSRPAPS